MGAAFLCADLGITPEIRDDHAAYIASWLEVLQNDKRFIFTAASYAQRAADYLHGLQPKAEAPRHRRLNATAPASVGRGFQSERNTMPIIHTYAVHELHWQGIAIDIHYCPDWSPGYHATYGYSLAHLQINAQGVPLPFTETGYRSHFDRADNIEAAGGPVAFVLAWLAETSRSKAWRTAQAERQQLTLF